MLKDTSMNFQMQFGGRGIYLVIYYNQHWFEPITLSDDVIVGLVFHNFIYFGALFNALRHKNDK